MRWLAKMQLTSQILLIVERPGSGEQRTSRKMAGAEGTGRRGAGVVQRERDAGDHAYAGRMGKHGKGRAGSVDEDTPAADAGGDQPGISERDSDMERDAREQPAGCGRDGGAFAL